MPLSEQSADLLGIEQDPLAGEGFQGPQGLVAQTLDVLMRGQYASAGFFDKLLSDGMLAVGSALKEGVSELFNPKERRSFNDLLEKHAPAFVARNPKSARTLGMVMDIGLDPTTYVSFGTAASARIPIRVGTSGGRLLESAGIGRKVLSAAGEETGDLVVALNKEGRRAYERLLQMEYSRGFLPNEAGRELEQKLIQHFFDRGYDVGDARKLAREKLLNLHGKGREHAKEFEGIFLERVSGDFAESGALRNMQRLIEGGDGGLEYIDRGGMKFLGKSVPGTQFIRASTGLSKLAEKSQLLKAFGRVFGRHFQIPEEIVQAEKRYLRDLEQGDKLIRREVHDIFKDLSPEERTHLGRELADMEEFAATKLKGDKDTFWTEEGVAGMLERRINELPEKERVAAVKLRSALNRIGDLEVRAELLTDLKYAYFPRYYELAKDPGLFAALRQKLRVNMSDFHGSAMARKFQTTAEAQAAGFDPIRDAGVLYALRVADHHRAMAKATFNDRVQKLMPELADVDFTDAASIARIKDRRLQHIANHVRFLGEGVYNSATDWHWNVLLRGYDRLMRIFRVSATVARPAFAARQTVSNAIQSYIGAGVAAIRGLWDPRAAVDGVLLHHWATTGKKGAAEAAGMQIRTVFGSRIGGEQLLDEIHRHRIVRNVTVEGIGKGTVYGRKGAQRLFQELDSQRWVKQKLGGRTRGADGMARLIAGSFDYMNLPALVEDHARISTFVNMRRAGYDPKTAAQLVDRALFDYTSGLSRAEERLMRRVVPFYSYQRFAVPLIAKATTQTPGRIANAYKAGKYLMETWSKFQSGEKLTPAERAAIPGWLLDQPHQFAGFQQDMLARFGSFHNFTPLDVLGFIRTRGDSEDMDVRETLLNLSLGQMAPAIKVPLEIGLDRDIFTGRSLEGVRKGGQLDVDKFLGNVFAMVAGSVTKGFFGARGMVGGAAGYAFAKALTGVSDTAGKRILGAMIGLEEGLDTNTGRRTVFFSPWRFHILSSVVPGVNDALKLSREDHSPTEKTSRFLFGISFTKLDLRQEAARKGKRIKRERAERVSDIRYAALARRSRDLRGSMLDFQRWAKDAAADVSALQRGYIRGPDPPQLVVNQFGVIPIPLGAPLEPGERDIRENVDQEALLEALLAGGG